MSDLEDMLLQKILAAGLPRPEKEFKFSSCRNWRFDFAFPDRLLAVEVEGGIYSGGRHTTGTGFKNDCEKYNSAVLDGWIILRFVREHIENPIAVSQIYLAISNFDNGNN